MSENLRQKGLTKVVKICVKITPDFVSKAQMDVKRGIMVLKGGVKNGSKKCRPALAGMGRLFLALWMRSLEKRGQGEVGWAEACCEAWA
jgi:hypothetical protein